MKNPTQTFPLMSSKHNRWNSCKPLQFVTKTANRTTSKLKFTIQSMGERRIKSVKVETFEDLEENNIHNILGFTNGKY